MGSEITLDTENGTDLWTRIATPRALLENEVIELAYPPPAKFEVV